MTIGGQGPMAMACMWVFTAIGLCMVVLRLYTRAVVVRSIGADDHMYAWTGLWLLLYTTFTQISANYGFGQDMATLSLDDSSAALFWEITGQTFAITGMAMAKWSLGLFLLRIVVKKWHQIAIWTMMITLAIVSISTAVCFWVQCTPVQMIWDRMRVNGECKIDVTPVSMLLGIWCIIADFFLAAFPWVFIWQLNMPRREKIIICSSMSLGVIAGICGIVRTIEVLGLRGEHYLTDTVPLIIWSAAEMCVTMVCIVIPVVRPLYRKLRGRDTEVYRKHNEGSDMHPGYEGELQTIGGSDMKKGGSSKQSSMLNSVSRTRDDIADLESGRKLGLKTMTNTYAVRGTPTMASNSEEEILGEEYHRNNGQGIGVKSEVRVERT